MKLGKLEKLQLRNYWRNEGTDFTPWLAQEENIQLLSEAICIDLEVHGQEKGVGPFRADILCKDTTTDHYVLIENQLEKTDHTHLGQLMTYAAGLDAVTIIWIAQRFTEEHRAALDWLNRITDDTFNFFGIEIELYKIGNSPAAPMFNIVSKPNGWSKSARTITEGKLSDFRLLQKEYWENFKIFLEENSSFKMQTPRPQYWANFGIGKSYFYLSTQIYSKEDSLGLMLNITGERAKSLYEQLYTLAYDDSLKELSRDIKWDKMENKIMCCVYLKTQGDFTNKSDWLNQFEWFKANLEKFAKFFKPKVKDL